MTKNPFLGKLDFLERLQTFIYMHFTSFNWFKSKKLCCMYTFYPSIYPTVYYYILCDRGVIGGSSRGCNRLKWGIIEGRDDNKICEIQNSRHNMLHWIVILERKKKKETLCGHVNGQNHTVQLWITWKRSI